MDNQLFFAVRHYAKLMRTITDLLLAKRVATRQLPEQHDRSDLDRCPAAGRTKSGNLLLVRRKMCGVFDVHESGVPWKSWRRCSVCCDRFAASRCGGRKRSNPQAP